jgi:hypothetical protein
MQAMTFMAPPHSAAGLDVDIEYTLESLRPCHGRAAFVLAFAGSSAALSLLPLPRFAGVTRRPVPTIGCEHPVEAG